MMIDNLPEIDFFIPPKRRTAKFIAENFPDLWNEMCKLSPDIPISERLYLVYHDMTERPLCKYCGKNHPKFNTLKLGYRIFCSASCVALDQDRRQRALDTRANHSTEKKQEIKEKKAKTNLERYGGTGRASKELTAKYKQTIQERYGDEGLNHIDIQNKRKQTCITKYGTEYALQSDEVKNKSKQTNLERYGVDNVLKSKEFREKAKQIKLDRYGDENYTNAEKRKSTMIEKYGVDNPQKLEEVREKTKRTNLERYGVEYIMQNKELAEKNTQSRTLTFLKTHDHILSRNGSTWTCKCPHLDCNKCDKKTYEITSTQYWARVEFNIEPCTNLFPIQLDRSQGNSLESFIRELLKDNNIEFVCNDRNVLDGKELDIYIPSKHIAIECNGIFWHSDKSINDKDYHHNKWLICKNKGIQLLTIWEDWIKTKPEITQSLVLSKLGIYKQKIGARQCEIREISSKSAQKFLNDNHIQGGCPSQKQIGLFYKDKLVSVMTFYQRDNEWEMCRFCSIKNTQIIGACSKLLNWFRRTYKPNSIKTYASNDISSGQLYINEGFNKINEIKHTYWYVESNTFQRFHRSSFSKSEIIRKGLLPEGTKDDWTEFSIMDDTNYYRIYDTGITTFELKVNNNGISN